MGGLQELLEECKRFGDPGTFLGLLHVLIGRRIQKKDGSPVSPGLTWRELADLLKRVRWDPEAVRDLGLDPADLPVRDRQRYWYSAISHAEVDSDKATHAGDELADRLRSAGYIVGSAPRPAQHK